MATDRKRRRRRGLLWMGEEGVDCVARPRIRTCGEESRACDQRSWLDGDWRKGWLETKPGLACTAGRAEDMSMRGDHVRRRLGLEQEQRRRSNASWRESGADVRRSMHNKSMRYQPEAEGAAGARMELRGLPDRQSMGDAGGDGGWRTEAAVAERAEEEEKNEVRRGGGGGGGGGG